MAEIIPALTKEVLSRMTAGEKRLAYRLKELLEDDYLVWYDIPVGRDRRYPDFIILHPARGLLFLEVKDWKATTLTGLDKHQATLQFADGLRRVANPLEQARQCMIQLVNRLKLDPHLQFEPHSPYAGKICMPYGYGAVFTNITRRQIEGAIEEADREIVLPDHKVIYKDEMTESADAEEFQKRLWDMFQFPFVQKLSLPQIDRIRWYLFPEVRIKMQDDLFAGDDSDSTVSSPNLCVPDIIKIMDIQQEQLARSLGSGHRVIHGVAGSGKTLILGYRCEMLAATSTKPILALCYNITLARALESVIKAKGLSDRVSVMYFHDWCGAQLKTYQVDVVKGIEPYWERQVLSVIRGVENAQIPRAQYGAILIDEGHDFDAEWLKLITQMIDPESDSLLLLYDDAQSIYKKRSGLGFSLSSVGVKAQGRTTILRLNYRNTREILDFAYRFALEFMGAEASDEDHVPLLAPESAGTSGPAPKVVRLSAWADELAHTLECIQAWRSQGLAWNDMVILYSTGSYGSGMANFLTSAGIPNQWLGNAAHKKSYDRLKNEVAIMTLHSSKGLEFPAVVIVGAQGLKCDAELEHSVRLMYVGMTRAQTHLEVTVSSETDLTNRLVAN
jgi:hypothetical protein